MCKREVAPFKKEALETMETVPPRQIVQLHFRKSAVIVVFGDRTGIAQATGYRSGVTQLPS